MGSPARPTVASQPPGGQILPTREDAQRAKQNFRQALQEASDNHAFQFRITDQEITSLAALELTGQAALPLSELQIWFSEGRIHLTGKLAGVGPAPVSVLIVARPLLNSNDQLEIQIDDARMGNFKLPPAVVENLTQTINETLADTRLEIQIQSAKVLEGEMVITGTRIAP